MPSVVDFALPHYLHLVPMAAKKTTESLMLHGRGVVVF